MDTGKACIPVFMLLILCSTGSSEDQITEAKPLSPGDTLISAGGDFALGFFSPTKSNKSLYIGIWYHNLPERIVVWVANRDSPVTTPSSAQLAITNTSELVLSDAEGLALWTTANNATPAAEAVAVLRSSGNLVLQAANGTVIWQSFDHPTDTVLPTMTVRYGYKVQTPTRIFAWKGPYDPSTGDFSAAMDPESNLQYFIWNGTVPYRRATVWNAASVSSINYQSNGTFIMYQEVVDTVDEFYYTYRVSDGAPYMRVLLDYTGQMKHLSWNKETSSWAVISVRPSSSCDLYGSCGLFGYCDNTEHVPTCHCLDGFELVDGVNFSGGCRRKEALTCGKKTNFVTLPRMKVPDKFSHIKNASFDQCAAQCSGNCSCTAYAYAKISTAGPTTDTSRCLIWTGDLVDTGKAEFGEDLYLRFADSSVPTMNRSSSPPHDASACPSPSRAAWPSSLAHAARSPRCRPPRREALLPSSHLHTQLQSWRAPFPRDRSPLHCATASGFAAVGEAAPCRSHAGTLDTPGWQLARRRDGGGRRREREICGWRGRVGD